MYAVHSYSNIYAKYKNNKQVSSENHVGDITYLYLFYNISAYNYIKWIQFCVDALVSICCDNINTTQLSGILLHHVTYDFCYSYRTGEMKGVEKVH